MALTSSMCLFGQVNHLVGAASTLNEPGVATGAPLSNLVHPSVWQRWVSATGQPSATLRLQRWDFGSAKEVGAVAVVGYKPTAAGTQLRARVGSVADFSSGVLWTSSQVGFVDTLPGLVDTAPRAGRLWLGFPPTPVSGRYFELGWLHDGSGADQFEAALVIVGPRLQFGEQFAPDWQRGRRFLGDRGHQVPQRYLKVKLHRMAPAEDAALGSIVSAIGTTTPIVVVPRPAAPETWQHEALYARFDEDEYESTPWTTSGSKWEASLPFAEVID